MKSCYSRSSPYSLFLVSSSIVMFFMSIQIYVRKKDYRPISCSAAETNGPDLTVREYFGDNQAVNPMREDLVPVNRGMFFVETMNITHFSPRSLCSYESAARKHPNDPVYVIQSSTSTLTPGPKYLTDAFPNLLFVSLDMKHFVRDSPLELIWDEVVSTMNFRENISNTLRLLFTYRFGGTYLDNDMLLLTKRPATKNLIVAQLLHEVNGAVLQFEKGNIFPITSMVEMASNFQGDVQNSQGPRLMTKIVKHLCPTPEDSDLPSRKCVGGMKVLPPYSAYPLSFFERGLYLQPEKMGYVRKSMQYSFAFHLWNYGLKKHTGNVTVTADQPFYQLFAENCPLVKERSLEKMLGKTFLETA